MIHCDEHGLENADADLLGDKYINSSVSLDSLLPRDKLR